jgi:succinate dehydrogenase / fumarate reductase iron-sulfur subunit
MVEVKFEVYRGADHEGKPHYEQFKVDVPETTPILTALLKIRDGIDPTLTMRYSCRQAICGSCAMKVNGKSRLVCSTLVGPEVKTYGKIRIDPPGNMPIMRDLVTDFSPFWERYLKVDPFLIDDPAHPTPKGQVTKMSPEQVEQFRETPRCIACGACYSGCPSVGEDPEYLGPMALAKAYRFVVDPRDHAYHERLLKLQGKGLWLCLRCSLCIEACPKEVRPADRITDLKRLANQEIGAKESGSRHSVAFVTNIEDGGLLNEFKLARQSLGMLGMFGQIGKGFQMMRHGKSFMHHPIIHDLDSLRAIYTELNKMEDLKHRERPAGKGVKGEAPA